MQNVTSLDVLVVQRLHRALGEQCPTEFRGDKDFPVKFDCVDCSGGFDLTRYFPRVEEGVPFLFAETQTCGCGNRASIEFRANY